LHSGVYAVGHRVLSQEAWWMAAVLFAGPGAVLSHRSAAALWRIRGTSRGAIEVTTPRKSRSRGAIHRHFAVLPADEVTTERGIPVTTVPRTIFDLAATSTVDVVEHSLRESEYLRLHDALSLPDLLARHPRHRAARNVLASLARRAETPGRSRGWLEERFLPFLRERGLPPPQLNAWIEAGEKWFEVDCFWPASRAIVELDGFAAHGTRVAFREDRARDRRLRVAGYGVTRIAPEQLDDEADSIAADLRALLATAA
jgi:very-short-patch-repair endonuclease